MRKINTVQSNVGDGAIDALASGLRAIAAQCDAAAVLEQTVALALALSGAAHGRAVMGDGAGARPPALAEAAVQSRTLIRLGNQACFALGDSERVLALVLLEGLEGVDLAGARGALEIVITTASLALCHAVLRADSQRDRAIQRKAEAELAFEQNLLRTLVDHLPFRIYAKDRASRFIFGNKLMARLAGLAGPAGLTGKTDCDFFPPELAAKYLADEMHVLESGQSLLDYEEQVQDQHTGELGWTVTTKVLLRDAAGAVSGVVGIGYDITSRKQMEARLIERTGALEQANATLEVEKRQQQVLIRQLSEMQGQLLQSEKMASIGLLAAGVAHEINNPLAFISANFSALERDSRHILELVSAFEAIEPLLPGDALAPIDRKKQEIGLEDIRLDLADVLGESMDGLKRVKRIVENLKDFSRVSGSTFEPSNLEQGLDSTLNVAWNEIKYKAEVVKQYAGLPEVSCLPSQINQVFLNLLINAAHAIEGRGSIILRTGFDAASVWVEIEDSGAGIDPAHLDRIFDPFFTTKPVGMGTGLGLSIVYGIVQAHRGSIEVRSVPGQGSCFRLRLPRSAE